ncbi:acyltransferase LovD [Echria macrotheca]|uniref:Acyltransferase LovD n=1 Tax=Echria macrotheca TaxID=438768 RepID=A0AAJ0B3W8_9PEZI|nr:acyltransferase LovD [Echria macrotheca]
MAWPIEDKILKAIEEGVLPGAVLLAKDKSGKINFTKSLGHASLSPTTPRPMTPQSLLFLASMTKLPTTLAILQLIQKPRSLELTLDTDITPYLPSLAAQPILTGFSSVSGEPILTPRTKPILLRHLLTHTSGCGYPFLSPSLARYASFYGQPIPSRDTSSVAARFDYPLLFEPGMGWEYGSGIDWAGVLVEVLVGTTLEDYFKEHILAPLGIAEGRMTFFPGRYLSEEIQVADMTARSENDDETKGRVVHAPFPPPDPKTACFGGEGLFASLESYMAILESLLLDDGKLLEPKMAAELFTPWLVEPEAKRALTKSVGDPGWIVGWVPPPAEQYDWGLGGLLVNNTEGDHEQHRKKGFLFWGGVFNLAWFIDRESGVCGVFGTQIRTPADPLVRPLIKAFEDDVYAKLAAGEQQKL